MTGFLVPMAAGLFVFGAWDGSTTETASTWPANPAVPRIDIPQLARIEVPVPTPLGESVDFVVRRNDTMERIFRQLQLNLQDLAALRTLPDVRQHVDSLRPGESLEFVHVNGALQSLMRRLSETSKLAVTRDLSGFQAQIVETPLEYRRVSAQGTIESSLFVSGRAAGVSADIVLRLANDIFGWDIDFALDIRRGDRFAVIYEQKFRDGAYLGDGRILAAEFVNDGTTFRAVRYESADGKVAGYFAPDGKSMRKQFLRAPVEFKYISSSFNPRRFHPVLNITRAHQGVDYAAPTGTPIRAAGDGRISFVGVRGGYGKAVVIEHGGSISTLYAHMSRHAKGMRAGLRVQQGDTVGFVGQTGTASGPHLHYEYRVSGIHKNPRTVALPDAQPLPMSYFGEFQTTATPLLSELDRAALQGRTIVAADR